MMCSGHVDLAITCYKQALLLRPDFPEATCNLLHTLQVNVLDFSTHVIFCVVFSVFETAIIYIFSSSVIG